MLTSGKCIKPWASVTKPAESRWDELTAREAKRQRDHAFENVVASVRQRGQRESFWSKLFK